MQVKIEFDVQNVPTSRVTILDRSTRLRSFIQAPIPQLFKAHRLLYHSA